MNKPIVSLPEYPFEDFLDDFTQVSERAHARQAGNFDSSLAELRGFMKGKYDDPNIFIKRSTALIFCLTYLADHMAEFDVGNNAIKGREESLVSEALLRGIHDVVAAYALNRTRPEPTIGEILRRSRIHENHITQSE